MKSLLLGALALVSMSVLQLAAGCSERIAKTSSTKGADSVVVSRLIAFDYEHHNGSMIYHSPEYTGSLDRGFQVTRNDRGQYILTTSRWKYSENDMHMIHDTILVPDTTVRHIINIVNACHLHSMPSYIEADERYMALDAGGWRASLQVDTFSTSLSSGDAIFPVNPADEKYPAGVRGIVNLLERLLPSEE